MVRTAISTSEMPAKLADSAFQLFSRHGFKKVNVDQIAAHTGVTKGSLYWHYKSKDDLIMAACNHYYRSYHRRINSETAHITDPIKRLEHTLEVSVQICLLDDENRVFTTEIFTLAMQDDNVRRSWQQFYDSVREFYIGLVKAAQTAGGIDTDDSEHAVDFMLATMEGIKLQAMSDPKICAKSGEKAIVSSLKRMIGFKNDF